MPDDADMLRTYLAERDTACPGCKYNLRGLTGERCPECNQVLVLRVGILEPKLGVYLGAISGLLAGMGTAAVFLGFFLYSGLRYRWPIQRECWLVFGIPSVSLAVLGLGLVFMLRTTTRVWMRKGSLRAAVLVLACWGGTAAGLLWFFSSIN